MMRIFWLTVLFCVLGFCALGIQYAIDMALRARITYWQGRLDRANAERENLRRQT